MCPPLQRERIPEWFCDNLSDYIIFRRHSTGGDFSVPQYIHSFGAIPNFSSLGIRRQNLDSLLRQLQTRTVPDNYHTLWDLDFEKVVCFLKRVLLFIWKVPGDKWVGGRLNCYLIEKEQLSHYGKAAQEFVLIKNIAKPSSAGRNEDV